MGPGGICLLNGKGSELVWQGITAQTSTPLWHIFLVWGNGESLAPGPGVPTRAAVGCGPTTVHDVGLPRAATVLPPPPEFVIYRMLLLVSVAAVVALSPGSLAVAVVTLICTTS